MQHGSLINSILSNGTPERAPVVGDGMTVCYWSDRRAATVIDVNKSGKTITLQFDIATRSDSNGMSDAQSYTYEADPNGATVQARRNRNGQWKVLGQGNAVVPGRRHFHDFSF